MGERLTNEQKAAAGRLLNPMAVAMERMSLEELGQARDAFAKASTTNCWWLVYALRELMLPIIAEEIGRRRELESHPA